MSSFAIGTNSRDAAPSNPEAPRAGSLPAHALGAQSAQDPIEGDRMQPLAGLKVVELHAIGPVPFAGYLLAQYGAQVVRISPPVDPGLGLEVAPAFDLLNSNKEALALDLKHRDGQAELERRLADADVLLEGFRPGVLERLGLDPAALGRRHPRLVIGRLSGWGEHGVLAPRAGHDINYLAVSGILHAIGSDREPEIPLNLIGDFGGGTMHLLVGILSALFRRSISGQGMVVTTSILAASIGLTPMIYGLLAAGAWTLRRRDNLLDGAAPYYRVYRCADDKHVAVGAIESRFYRALLELTGLQHRLDPAQQNNRAQWPQAIAAFSEVFATRDRDSWAHDAENYDCCVAPVLDFLEASAYPHNRANKLFRPLAPSASAEGLGKADSVNADGLGKADSVNAEGLGKTDSAMSSAHADPPTSLGYIRPEPVIRFQDPASG